MTELTLHGARPAGAPHPRLGYAMVTAASALFAINGSVSKIILTEGDISSLRLTELRATGAFVGLAAFALVTAPARLRIAQSEVGLLVFYGIVGFALVQWLYLVAIERLPIGIGLILEFTAPVRTPSASACVSPATYPASRWIVVKSKRSNSTRWVVLTRSRSTI